MQTIPYLLSRHSSSYTRNRREMMASEKRATELGVPDFPAMTEDQKYEFISLCGLTAG